MKPMLPGLSIKRKKLYSNNNLNIIFQTHRTVARSEHITDI